MRCRRCSKPSKAKGARSGALSPARPASRLPEQRRELPPDVLEHQRLRLGGRMHEIGLKVLALLGGSLEWKRQERNLVLPRELGVCAFELRGVLWTVVRRHLPAHHHPTPAPV